MCCACVAEGRAEGKARKDGRHHRIPVSLLRWPMSLTHSLPGRDCGGRHGWCAQPWCCRPNLPLTHCRRHGPVRPSCPVGQRCAKTDWPQTRRHGWRAIRCGQMTLHADRGACHRGIWPGGPWSNNSACRLCILSGPQTNLHVATCCMAASHKAAVALALADPLCTRHCRTREAGTVVMELSPHRPRHCLRTCPLNHLAHSTQRTLFRALVMPNLVC